MKTLIQYNNNKFFNSLANHIPDNIFTKLDGLLYGLYFQYNFDKIFMVAEKELSREINNFIIEFQEKKQIFLYHQSEDSKHYSDIFKKTKHIAAHGVKLNGNYFELPKYFVNEKLFNNSSSNQRKDKYCVFLEMRRELPASLESLLYPKSTESINMFNSPYINHYQNMGIISEAQKSEILKQYKYFIDIDGCYAHEAHLCGCNVVEISEDNKTFKKKTINTNATTIKKILEDISYEQ